MELKEGMFVRIKDGGIDKITSIFDDEIRFREKPIFSDGECIGYKWCYKKDIIKASFDIIDLIQVGDYVNDMKVEKNKYHGLYINDVYCCGTVHYMNFIKDMKKEDIKSIVTHEQFENMKYKVE